MNRTEEAVAKARTLRSEAGKSEMRMWRMLRRKALGARFRRQHPIGPYVLDFYCPDLALCIEVDGELHDPSKDAVRDSYLASLAIKTVRVRSWNLFDKDSLLLEFLEEQIRLRRSEIG